MRLACNLRALDILSRHIRSQEWPHVGQAGSSAGAAGRSWQFPMAFNLSASLGVVKRAQSGGGGVQTSRVALELNYENVLRETTTTKTNNEGKSLGGTCVICNMNQNPDLISVVSCREPVINHLTNQLTGDLGRSLKLISTGQKLQIAVYSLQFSWATTFSSCWSMKFSGNFKCLSNRQTIRPPVNLATQRCVNSFDLIYALLSASGSAAAPASVSASASSRPLHCTLHLINFTNFATETKPNRNQNQSQNRTRPIHPDSPNRYRNKLMKTFFPPCWPSWPTRLPSCDTVYPLAGNYLVCGHYTRAGFRFELAVR